MSLCVRMGVRGLFVYAVQHRQRAGNTFLKNKPTFSLTVWHLCKMCDMQWQKWLPEVIPLRLCRCHGDDLQGTKTF